MNMFSCSLSCTWMTIINCLFYAFDSFSLDVLLEYIAKLVVVWLYNLCKCVSPAVHLHLDRTDQGITIHQYI